MTRREVVAVPEPERPADRGGGPEVRNTASGTVGGVVQAGVVHGGLHLHAPPPRHPVVPRQLPAAPEAFTGREAELAALDRALADRALAADPGQGAAVAVSAVGGVGGVGKTWLVLAWAHRNLHRFPDGQLFVDLRGFSPTGRPTDATDALRGFLTALGADPRHLPTSPDALAALYRGLIAGRRILIVLDNAATADQTTPLLPGTPTCTVLITGRTTLPSLIDRHGARHLHLDVLTHTEAHTLLTTRLGAHRTATEPRATDELITLCGRHPLALAITARHATTHPTIPLTEFATELRDLGLDALDDDDPAASLPTVLSWSLRHLTHHQRTTFALLGITPGPDTDLPAATSLTGLTEAHTRKILHALEQHSLLDRHPGGRYSTHDLIRAYATATAHEHLPEPVRRAALDRVVDSYLHTAFAAERLLHPHRRPIRLDPPTPGVHPTVLPDHRAALAWLDTHHPHLLAAQRTAAAHHRHQTTWDLAWTLMTHHQWRHHRHDNLTAWRTAAEAADHLPDPAAGILAHRHLGLAHAALGLHGPTVEHLHRSLAAAEHHRDPVQQARTHHALAWVWGQREDHHRALEHARRALDLFRAADLPVWEALALNAVGRHAAHLGDHDTALDHCRAALELHRRHHDPAGEADALDSLGYLAHRTGRHEAAVEHHRRAVDLLRALGNTSKAADALDSLGLPLAALGEHERARAAWREALALYRRQGREADADRVRRRLDDLGPPPAG